VAIVGSGLIGRSWAMLFASVGYEVSLYDVLPEQVEGALKEIARQLKLLKENGFLRGTRSESEQVDLIKGSTNLKECVHGAIHIQENVPERIEIKRKVLAEIDAVMPDGCVLASSTSAMLPSTISDHLKHKDHFIVAHPVNPPYYVPLVELVPAPWTLPEVVTRTRAIMTEIGQSPVTVAKELKGFILNRIQYAIINECWRLIRDGYINVADVDTVMSEGLGMRYAFLGPLETAHLNAEGMQSYIERYGDMIYDISTDSGPVPRLEGPTADTVVKQLEEKVPIDQLQKRREWRDKSLSALAKIKREIKQ